MEKFLKINQEGSILTITMDQGSTKNALTGNSAIEEFCDVCERINNDSSIKVVVLTGAGSAFSSGGNVKEMGKYADPDVSVMDIRDEYRRGIQKLTLAMYKLEVPIIAAVNGAAFGAGCDLACMCDIRIASANALFAESFIRVGIVPGDGGAWLLPRAVGMSKAAEMSFTGEAITAEEALQCGLVSKVVKSEELLSAANAIAQKIALNPGKTLRLTKYLLREGQTVRLESLLELSASFQALAHKTEAHNEAVNAFKEKRKPDLSKY